MKVYTEQLELFKENAVDFYKWWHESFLKDKGKTFYCHMLEDKFLMYGLLGHGIFQCKQLKDETKKAKNVNSPTILVNNLQRLSNVFLYHNDAY
jgi:hypothetical protein